MATKIELRQYQLSCCILQHAFDAFYERGGQDILHVERLGNSKHVEVDGEYYILSDELQRYLNDLDAEIKSKPLPEIKIEPITIEVSEPWEDGNEADGYIEILSHDSTT